MLPTARTTAAQEIGRVGMYVQSRGERCRGRETEEDWERPEGRRAEREMEEIEREQLRGRRRR